MPYSNPNFIAGGTIAPCRLVSMVATGSTPADFTVWQSTAGAGTEGDMVTGVSQEGTRRFDSADAAIVGEQLRVFGPGETPLVEVGATPVTAGVYVKSDANGKIIPVATDQDRVAGQALQAGAAGEKVQVMLNPQIWHVI